MEQKQSTIEVGYRKLELVVGQEYSCEFNYECSIPCSIYFVQSKLNGLVDMPGGGDPKLLQLNSEAHQHLLNSFKGDLMKIAQYINDELDMLLLSAIDSEYYSFSQQQLDDLYDGWADNCQRDHDSSCEHRNCILLEKLKPDFSNVIPDECDINNGRYCYHYHCIEIDQFAILLYDEVCYDLPIASKAKRA